MEGRVEVCYGVGVGEHLDTGLDNGQGGAVVSGNPRASMQCHNIREESHVQRCQIGESFYVVVALRGDGHGLQIISPVDDTMTDVDDLRAVYVSFLLEVVQEMREGSGVVVDGFNGFLLGFAPTFLSDRREFEGEKGRRCGDISDAGLEEQLYGFFDEAVRVRYGGQRKCETEEGNLQ